MPTHRTTHPLHPNHARKLAHKPIKQMLVGESEADSLGIEHLRRQSRRVLQTRPNHRDSPSPTRSQADRALIAWGLRPVWSSRSLSPVTIASALDSRANATR